MHCTGKAGDCFLANYMTAHLIAPVSTTPLFCSPCASPSLAVASLSACTYGCMYNTSRYVNVFALLGFWVQNSAPHIRYAVYFRVHGSCYDKSRWSAPMLQPWLNWPGLSDTAVGAVAEQQKSRHFRAAVDSIEVANIAAGRASHYQTVDNFHAVQQARGAE